MQKTLSPKPKKHEVPLSSKAASPPYTQKSLPPTKPEAMRKPEHTDDEDLELLKAVAQAWHAQSGNPRHTQEFDAQKNHFKSKPSRFKLEAITMASKASQSNWDFSQSLWDSYEIVTLSKKLEANLALDQPVPRPPESTRPGKRARESKNSLRNWLQRTSSKRSSRNAEPRE